MKWSRVFGPIGGVRVGGTGVYSYSALRTLSPGGRRVHFSLQWLSCACRSAYRKDRSENSLKCIPVGLRMEMAE